MTSDNTLTIDRDIDAGETFTHDGSIIFKTRVPDGVKATATNGGIVLTQGGGNDLTLKAHRRSSAGMSISMAGGSGRTTIIIGSIVTNSLNIGGENISGNFPQTAEKPEHRGVFSHLPVGNDVTIVTDSDVNLADAGDRLNVDTKRSLCTGAVGDWLVVDAGGGFTAMGDTGNDARIAAGDDIGLENIGDRPMIDGSGALNAANIGKEAGVDVQGDLVAENLDEGGAYGAAGSVTISGTIGINTKVESGGSIRAAYARSGAELDAMHNITLGGADRDIETDAGGCVQIGSAATPELKPQI